MPRKLKTLTIGEKQRVLEAVKSGRKKKDMVENTIDNVMHKNVTQSYI